MQRSRDARFTLWLLVVAVLGSVFYITSLALSGESAIVVMLRDAGVSLLIAVLIGVLVDRAFHRSLYTVVDERLRESSNVLEGASASGVRDIFARRGGSEERERWSRKVREAIKEEILSENGCLRVYCVAAPQIFRKGSDIGDELWMEFVKQGTSQIRVLVMCPESPGAEKRAALESPHPTREDIRITANFLAALRSETGGRVWARCYAAHPASFIIITDKWLFLEPYPLAQLDRSEVPLGGRTPMLVFDRDSKAYRLWSRHFDYIWNTKDQSTEYCEHHRTERDWEA